MTRIRSLLLVGLLTGFTNIKVVQRYPPVGRDDSQSVIVRLARWFFEQFRGQQWSRIMLVSAVQAL